MIAVFLGSLSTAMSTATSTHPVRQVQMTWAGQA